MQIRVLFFGMLKDVVGQSSQSLELPPGARVSDLLSQCVRQAPRMSEMLSSLAISVNQEYASADRRLDAGDEVALLPPVSGGAGREAQLQQRSARIVREPIVSASIVSALVHPEDGAAVVFEGVVRNQTRGRRTLFLDYEAYEEMALSQMEALAVEARSRFAVRDVAIVHRLGRLEIGETSVLIAVTSAHRGPAFDACRWVIDTLKKTVPIWKKEHFEDGAVWADGEPFPEEIRGLRDTGEGADASK
ncbi:MAG TPA: molybdenum cofactor biosynthesis protein MoaE [Terriglobales bacterium]